MATPVFPSALPGVSSHDWVAGPQGPVTGGDIGAKTNRRITAVPSAVANVTWRFLEQDFSIFQDFYNDSLIRGHRWFRLTLPCGAGYAQHVVRFMSHRVSPSNGYGWREVTAQLEVRERKLRPNAFRTTITSTPYPLYVLESIDSGLVPHSGLIASLREFATVVDGVDPSAAPVAGTIRVALLYFLVEDSIDAEVQPIEGILRTALISLELYHDEINSSCEPQGGMLRAALIRVDIPPESLNSNCAPVAGTLT